MRSAFFHLIWQRPAKVAAKGSPMHLPNTRLRARFVAVSAAALALSLSASLSIARAQLPPAGPAVAQQPNAAAQPKPTAQTLPSLTGPDISEDELKQMLAGKTFYLRGGYLNDSLAFDQHGNLSGHAPQGSYTLNLIQIEKVHLGKRRLELEGIRYGLHFLGALPYEDPANAVDRVRITPKKKVVKITIDREQIVKAKKEKARKPGLVRSETTGPHPQAAPSVAGSDTAPASRAHSAAVLRQALDAVFAPSLDARMLAAMPEFWKLYYQAAAAKRDFRPADPSVLLQKAVDRKARLLTSFQPQSNQYAQDAGVAGMALYHAVIGADGRAEEIAVARPIGFGLDENAAEAIRNARFEPALKNGKPVPVLLDLVVEFRIYSKRTAPPQATGAPAVPAAAPQPTLPGPYSAQHAP
jgi:TonB family protein